MTLVREFTLTRATEGFDGLLPQTVLVMWNPAKYRYEAWANGEQWTEVRHSIHPPTIYEALEKQGYTGGPDQWFGHTQPLIGLSTTTGKLPRRCALQMLSYSEEGKFA